MPRPSPTSTRSTAAARREHLLEVSIHEFAQLGYEGGSTERIARAAGISQPYVFRLFGSKLQLFIAVIERCFEEMQVMFETAAQGQSGQAALDSIGAAYRELIATRPERLQCQLVGYVACDEPAVRETMRAGFGRLVEFAEQASGMPSDQVASFFARGMLLNALTAMRVPQDPTPWGERLLTGSG